MSDLITLQQTLLRSMLHPSLASLDDIRGNSAVDTSSRLAIYQQGYRMRLCDALSTEFPGLRLMARRNFQAMLDAYIDAQPSSHFNIRWHGAGMASFLAHVSPWRENSALAEMAQLDWAISIAFDAADESTLAASDLSAVSGEAWGALRLYPQAHLQIVSSGHNIDAFRRAADRGAQSPRLRQLAKPRHLLVWRHLLDVRYRPIPPDEQAVLEAAMRGESFAQLCERMAGHHRSSSALPRMATLVAQWLKDGLIASMALPAAV